MESVLRPTLLMGGEPLPWATSGKYTGQVVHEDCGLDAEVAARGQAARVAGPHSGLFTPSLDAQRQEAADRLRHTAAHRALARSVGPAPLWWIATRRRA